MEQLADLVDIGWHTFILYTREYAAFCAKLAGHFIHHAPDDVPGESGTGGSLAATIDAMQAAGYWVDPALWPKAADCSQKCNQCHAGCYDSPQKTVG